MSPEELIVEGGLQLHPSPRRGPNRLRIGLILITLAIPYMLADMLPSV